jgi:hypothetical protein
MIVVGDSWSDRYSRRDPLVGIRHALDLVMWWRGSSSVTAVLVPPFGEARNNRIKTTPKGASWYLKLWLSGAKSRADGHPISASGVACLVSMLLEIAVALGCLKIAAKIDKADLAYYNSKIK